MSELMSAWRKVVPGKLVGNELERIGSMSIARAVVKPAFLVPRARPPQPLKRSRMVGMGSLSPK